MVYQGSKRRYAKYIVPILQDAIDTSQATTFVDLCCGGCNIIDKIKCENRIAIDNNPYLISLFETVRDRGESIFPEEVTKQEWNRVKANPDDCPWLTAIYALFCSYSARGFAGGFCCTPAHGDAEYQSRKKNLLAQLPNLLDVEFRCQNILTDTLIFPKDSVIYIDPPYKGTKKYDSSKEFDYNIFWGRVRELSRNHKVFVSEQSAPPDFKSIWSLEVKRNIFGKGNQTTENLFITDLT